MAKEPTVIDGSLVRKYGNQRRSDRKEILDALDKARYKREIDPIEALKPKTGKKPKVNNDEGSDA